MMRRLLLITAVLAIAYGCSDNDATPSEPWYPETYIPNNVIVIDEQPDLRFHNITEDELTLICRDDPGIEPGDILVGTNRGGYVRRAVELEADSTFLRISTLPATFGSAVRIGHAGGSFEIGPGSPGLAISEGPVSGAGISLTGIVLLETGGSSVRIENGYLAFSPAVDVSLSMYLGKVSGLEVSVDGDMEIDLGIAADLPEAVSHEGTVRVVTLRRTEVLWIGRVPVPLAIEMSVYLDSVIEGSTTGRASAAMRGTLHAGAGVAWSGSWERVGPAEIEAGFDQPVLASEYLSDFSIETSVRIEVGVSFFGSDAAVIDLEPRLGASGDAGNMPAWRWSVDCSLLHSGSFESGILDDRLPSFSAPPLAVGARSDRGPYESDSHILVREWSGAGTGGTGLEHPYGIAVGPDGAVFVTDQGSHRVIAYGPLGEYLTEWGSYGSAPGFFAFPSGIDVASDGTVLVSDSGNRRVQRFTSGGDFLGEWGEEGSGEGQFVQPEGLAAGPDSLMAVCDGGTGTVSIFTVTGRFVARYSSTLVRGAAFDAGSDIYSAGCGSGGITRTDREGQPLGIIGPDLCVTDLAIDPAGMIFVLDYGLDKVEILDASGSHVSSIGSTGSEPGQFDRPSGVAVSPEGLVYVADTGNGRVQVFAPK